MTTTFPQNKNPKPGTDDHLVIKKINHNTIDCFLQKGWDQWGRFKIKFGKDQNQLFQIKGYRFPKDALEVLEEKYNATHP